MNVHTNEAEIRRQALAIGIWENEGGAPGYDSMDRQYGRRVEADGSWSIFHVFKGPPADMDGHSMTGLSRSSASEGIKFLNGRNERWRREPNRLTAPDLKNREIDEGRS